MGGNNIRIRRNVFRSGKISTKRDFRRFEKGYKDRVKKESRNKSIILMIAIIILTIILIFSIRALSYVPINDQPEKNIQVTNQIL